MNPSDIIGMQEHAKSRIILSPGGQSVVDALRQEREDLWAIIRPSSEWFQSFARSYREHREKLFTLASDSVVHGPYWPAPRYRQCMEEAAWHFSNAEEALVQTCVLLEEHEKRHPMIQSLLQNIPAYELRYGPIFYYFWAPVTAWEADLRITWWDGPSEEDLRGYPRTVSHTRGHALDRRYTLGSLEVLRERWLSDAASQRWYGVKPEDVENLTFVEEPDGRSAQILGYVPPDRSDLRDRPPAYHFLTWACKQRLPVVSLNKGSGGETELPL